MEDRKKPGLVTFGNEQNTTQMINVTKMAKAFDKKPTDWLRLKSAKRFLTVFADYKDIPLTELIIRVGKNDRTDQVQGIYFHEDIAIEFARWLSPSFAIWNNRHTKELLITGETETTNSGSLLPVLVSDFLATEYFDKSNDEQTRKAIYHDAVLQSQTLVSATVIAKELGMSAMALNKLLHEKKIIFKSDNHWVLYADYQGKGYAGTKTVLYIDSNGKYQSNIHTYWTERGREFIHELLGRTKRIA